MYQVVVSRGSVLSIWLGLMKLFTYIDMNQEAFG